MSDYYSAGALGSIAGQLDALSNTLWVNQMFDGIAANRAAAQRLEQIRTEWAGAYEQLRHIALDLDAKVARLEADIALRDHQIANMKRKVFDRDGTIHDLESEVNGLRRKRHLLYNAALDYRGRLGIVGDEHDTAFT